MLGATLAGLLLTACGDRATEDRQGSGGAPGTVDAVPVLECPAELVSTDGVPRPAEAVPDLPALDAALVCTYLPGSGTDGAWGLDGGASEVPGTALAGLDAALAALEPAPADQMCTMDIGPRVLLLGATADGVVGVVAEDYGCRDVLLTSDPATVAPGEGGSDLVPAGSLAGDGLLEQLRSLL